MNAYNMIRTDLRKTIINALKLKIIVNPQECTDNEIMISSQNTFFRNQFEYLQEYAHSYEKRKYLCALNDGSFFQIHYEFEKRNKHNIYVKKMNLCYLPAVQNQTIAHNYIRLDFEANAKNSFFHSQAHMHIGFDDGLRIPVDEIPLFSDFFEMILFFYYPELLPSWNSNLTIGHTIIKEEGRISKCRILPLELDDYFHFHQKRD